MPKSKEKCRACGNNIIFDKISVKGNNKKQRIARHCKKCLEGNTPISKITENEFHLINTFGIINTNDENSEIDFFSASQKAHLKSINEVLQRTEVDDYDDELSLPSLNCNYYSPEEFLKSNFDDSKTFSVIHLNIHSIQKHIE